MSDALFQDISTVQSDLQATPKTLASAATIAPTTFLTDVTGTVQVETITAPVTGTHMIALNFTNASPGAFLTTGNIKTAYTPVQNRPILLIYNPIDKKYYVLTVA